jgi:hypothetical protein
MRLPFTAVNYLCPNGQIGDDHVVKVPVRFLNPLVRWTFPRSEMRENLMASAQGSRFVGEFVPGQTEDQGD